MSSETQQHENYTTLEMEPADARRIVACVNGCEGINPDAVPDLLAACEAFAKWFEGWCPNQKCCASTGLPVHNQVVAAIRKAKGGTQ